MNRHWWLFAALLVGVVGCRPPAQPGPNSFANPSQKGRSSEESTPVPPALASLKAVRAEVKPYQVSASLAEVSNLAAFKKAISLSPDEEKKLAANLFVCSPTGAEQLFHLYENNDYLNLPSFVTTDAVLQLYHIFYDFTLRTAETEALLPELQKLTEGMLAESARTWKEASDPELKSAALKNVAYFGVAAQALSAKAEVPSEAVELVRQEKEKIDRGTGFEVSAIFPYKIDYSQFKVRGHYTRSEPLKRYFRAMMWYGLTPFALRYGKDGQAVRADEPIRQSLLLVRGLFRAGLDETWTTVYEPTAFYVGAADDLTPAEWKTASDTVYGKDPAPGAFAEPAKLDTFVGEVQKARSAKIRARSIQSEMPDPDVQLRFMGQRYIPDSEILQRLSAPIERVYPSGLDVMAVMGSPRATAILDSHAEIYNSRKWDQYVPERSKLAGEFGQVKPEKWTSNLYWNWLYSLQALLEPAPEGYPSFMRNDAWADKSVHTALGSWAELRHDTILYGKQSVAECGDGEQPPFVKGYVEPNVVFYDRLLKLTEQTRKGLSNRKLLTDRLRDRCEQFEDLLTFLKTASEKELRNEALSQKEYEQIRYIGGQLESMTLSVMQGNPDRWELVSETDRSMAVVADVHTGDTDVLEEGVGPAYEILAIVPVEGKLVLTRGAVFSYFEFRHPMNDRMTDEAWQKELKAGNAPAPPAWTESFLIPEKPKRIKSKELQVYSSGC